MVWIILSWVCLILSITLIGVGLFWDRPGFRGRPQRWCRKCKYNLSGAGEVPVMCTECGREHATEKSLRRVRRHRRVVLLGLMILLGAGVLSQVPRGLRGELFKPVPNWVLVELQPLFPEDAWSIKNHPSRELTDRLMDTMDPMPRAEIVDVINGIADGSVFAEAGSKRWARTSGRWIGGQVFRFGSKEAGWNYPDKTPADEQLLDALDRLLSVLPQWKPLTRERWPEGYRVKIESGSFHPRWPTKGYLNERAVLRLTGQDEIVNDGFIDHFDIDPIGKAGDVISGEIELSYFRVEPWDRTQSRDPVKVETFPISWRVVHRVEDAVDLVRDPQIDQIVLRECVGVRVGWLTDYVDRQNPVWTQPRFEELGMGLVVQYLNDAGPIMERYMHWVCKDGQLRGPTSGGNSFVPYEHSMQMVEDARRDGTLRVRITGDPRIGLNRLEADRIWVGEIDMLYSEALAAAEKARAGEQEETPPETAGP